MYKVAVVLAFIACVFADEELPQQQPGPDPNVVYHHLAHKQLYVNKAAEHKGAGTGTAHYVGVPGTDVNGHGYGYGHGHDGRAYGHDGHAYGHAYGHDGHHYGHDGYGYGAPYGHKGAYYNYGPHNDHFYGARGYDHGKYY